MSDPIERAALEGPASYQPGDQVGGGRYRIVRQLGRGGMSIVFQARDTALGEDVALKFLFGSLSQSGFGEIREEVRLAHRVAHPNVCRVHDLEEIDGRHCIKMEYVGGRTLDDLRKSGRMPPREVIRIATSICAGLDAVHAQGIVHRDLKPSNIVIEHGSGRVVLMDFGLARARLDGDMPVAGTPAYMSPEQAAGRAPDPRSDLYSLGVILYELAAGQRPFAGKSVEEITQAHLHQQPQPLGRDVPADLRRVILRLLEKDPDARFASGAAVRDALVQPQRRRRLLQLGVGGLAVLAALAVLRFRSSGPTPVSPDAWRPILKPLSAKEENLDKFAVSPDGRHIAIASTRGGNWDIWLVEVATARWTPLTNDPEGDEAPAFIEDGKAVLFFSTRAGKSGLWRVDVDRPGPPVLVKEMPRGKISADAEGRKILYARSGRDVALLDLPSLSSTDVAHFPGNDGFTDLVLSPDGKRAIVGVRKSSEGGFYSLTRSDLYLITNTRTGEGKYLTTDSDFNCTATFIPDEPDAIIMSSHRGGAQSLWKLFLDGRAPVLIKPGGGGDAVFPVMSPDGKQLFFNHDNTVSQLFMRRPHETSWRALTSDLFDHTSPSFDARGKTVVYATYDRDSGMRKLWLAEAPDFATPRPLGELGDLLEPALAPDGKELVATRIVGEQRVVVLLGVGGKLIGTLTQGRTGSFCGGPSLSADHQFAAFAHDRGEEVGLYVVPRAGAEGALTPLVHDVTCYARFSPVAPGQLAYLRRTSPGQGQLEILDLSTRKTQKVAQLPFDSTRVAWDPSGDAIYVSDYATQRIRRVTLADQKIEDVVEAPGDDLAGFAVAPGGLLLAEGSVGRTRLLAIENIEQSPR